MRSRLLAVEVLTLCACLVPGCATIEHADYIRSDEPLPVANNLPRIRIDHLASGMELQYDTGQSNRYSRQEVLSAIESLWNKSKPPESPVVPARVFIRGSIVDERGWLWAIVGTYWYAAWSLFGGPTYSSTASVEIEIELKGIRNIRASGTGKCFAGMWYPGDPSACAFDKAIVDALWRWYL